MKKNERTIESVNVGVTGRSANRWTRGPKGTRWKHAGSWSEGEAVMARSSLEVRCEPRRVPSGELVQERA